MSAAPTSGWPPDEAISPDAWQKAADLIDRCPECGGRGLVVVEREPITVYEGECCGNYLPTGECCAAIYGPDRLVPVPHLEPVYEEVACPVCAPKEENRAA